MTIMSAAIFGIVVATALEIPLIIGALAYGTFDWLTFATTIIYGFAGTFITCLLMPRDDKTNE
jgi:hypothetical protein